MGEELVFVIRTSKLVVCDRISKFENILNLIKYGFLYIFWFG